MGLKEKVTSIKGMPLITSFVAGQTADSLMTGAAVNLFNARELNPVWGQDLSSTLEQNEVFALKTAVIAIMVGVYALTSSERWKDFKIKVAKSEIKPNYVLEKSLQAGNILAWGSVLFNSVQITPDIIRHLSS